MKRRFSFSIIGLFALAQTLCAQTGAEKTVTEAEVKKLGTLVQNISTQQKTIADNQTKIDAALAEITEQLRLTKAFISRGK